MLMSKESVIEQMELDLTADGRFPDTATVQSYIHNNQFVAGDPRDREAFRDLFFLVSAPGWKFTSFSALATTWQTK